MGSVESWGGEGMDGGGKGERGERERERERERVGRVSFLAMGVNERGGGNDVVWGWRRR